MSANAQAAPLRGKTLFITGASRGIGKAIAMRAARDGANVVVAAKTATENAVLPGTVHTAAAEIEAEGGRALAVVLDVRDPEAVTTAVERSARHFGGIDILVNNASAIHIGNIETTPIKRFALMLDVNVRGAFLCAQACLPHLRRAANPHVLSLSPPLDIQSRWFAKHAAYSTSKFAMSMMALGIAEENRDDGIASNGLWPRTLIATSALRIAAAASAERARKPEIMADAAHWILTQPSRELTGRFFLDERVLRDLGVENFDTYRANPHVEPELDFFVE